MMHAKQVLAGGALVAALVVGGCAGPSAGGGAMPDKTPAPTAEAMAEKPAETMMKDPTPEAMGEKPAETMMKDATPGAMADKPAETMMKDATPEAMADKPAETMMKDATPEAMAKDAAPAPAWYAAALADVNTGETFTVADLKGKVVLVEAMAVWCSTCLRQQREVVRLHEQLGDRDDYASVALGIDPNETADALRGHAAKHGFDWKYALSSVEVSRELAALYGDQFINPPVAPMLVIDRSGEAHVLPFGVKSAEQLNELIQPFLAEEM